MSGSRSVPSLFDGIDSITGAHKGRGIINLQEKIMVEPPKDVKEPIDKSIKPLLPKRSEDISTGDTQYDITIVNDYTELSQALDLKGSFITALNSSSLSTESALLKKAKLSKQSVSLLIKGKQIGYVQIMPRDIKVSDEHIDSLKKHRATFIEAHGDEYVSQVMYGKKIYALINFANASKEDALQIKHILEAKVSPKASISSSAIYNLNSTLKHTTTDINLEYSGVDLGMPSIGSNIEGLFAFIDQFNKAEIIGSPIGYLSEPYVTLMPIPEAAEIAKQMNMVQGLLSEYDKTYNKIRILIPSIEKLVSGARYFNLDESNSKQDLEKLEDYLTTAQKFKKLLEDLILEITINKTDLTCLPEKLSDEISLNIPPLKKSDELSDDAKISEFHKRQFDVRRQLNNILSLCTNEISNMEAEIDILTRRFSAEIVKITSKDDHVHLNLPPAGAIVKWNILRNPEKDDGGINSFNIKVKGTKDFFSKYFKSYSRLHSCIANEMETKISVTPSDRVKIEPNDKGDYVVIGSIVGLAALDPAIPRHSTSWDRSKWVSSKAKESKKSRAIVEFNGKSGFTKTSVPWLPRSGSFFSPKDVPDAKTGEHSVESKESKLKV